MRGSLWLGAACLIAVSAGSVQAGNVIKLRLDSKPEAVAVPAQRLAGEATPKVRGDAADLMTLAIRSNDVDDDDTELVRYGYRGGWGGGYRGWGGGYRGWGGGYRGWGGGWGGYGYRGWGWGGYRGWGWGGYGYRGWGWGGYRGWGWGNYYGWGGYYRPWSYYSYYSPYCYYSPYYYYPQVYYPSAISYYYDTPGLSDLSIRPRNLMPEDAGQQHSPDGTYPYDGGPKNPAPMPNNAPPKPMKQPERTVPLEGKVVSLPPVYTPERPQYSYPAYGEKTNAVKLKIQTAQKP